MQVSVEVKEGLKRQVKVSVPAEQVEKAISKRLAEMTGKVKIKGFRAGQCNKRPQRGDQRSTVTLKGSTSPTSLENLLRRSIIVKFTSLPADTSATPA